MSGKRTSGIVILVAVIFLTGFLTDTLRANWKYAGGTLPDKESGQTLAFYDSENLQHLSNGDVQVWVKTIDASEIDRFVTHEKEIVKNTAEKVAKSYYPPYLLSNPDLSPNSDTYVDIIVWEEAANHADIRTRAKLLYEIGCKEGMIQTLSAITYKSDGTATFSSDFDKRSQITPESTGDTLRRILCK